MDDDRTAKSVSFLGAEWKRYRSRPVWVWLAAVAICTLPLTLSSKAGIGPVALLPPATALACVLVTRRVVLSMLLGVSVGSVLQHGVLWGLPSGVERYFYQRLITPTNLCITGFALSVLSMVKLTEASGSMRALILPLSRRLRSTRATMLGTAGIGLLVFFDDYANTMLVGPTLRPVADRQGISREKLAYIVDSTAAPVAGIAIVSTWLAYEVGLLQETATSLGVEQGGYALLINALPQRFYCLFALALVFILASSRRDYGPMLKAEARALGAAGRPRQRPPEARPSQETASWLWLNAAVPVATLVLGTFLGFAIDGGAPQRLDGDPSNLFALAFWQQTLESAKHGPLVLLCSGCSAFVVALIATLWSGALSFNDTLRALGSGLRTVGPAIAILYCAWALGDVCKDLNTGGFLVASLRGEMAPAMMPLFTFFAAAVVAFATGTSWGTMAILIPAALPLAHELGSVALLIPTIAAVLDGAIFGDHCSPMSDTTLLSSVACGCDVLAHVWTQLPYALTAMVVAAAAYATTQLIGVSVWVVLPTGVLLLYVAVRFLGRLPAERQPTASSP